MKQVEEGHILPCAYATPAAIDNYKYTREARKSGWYAEHQVERRFT